MIIIIVAVRILDHPKHTLTHTRAYLNTCSCVYQPWGEVQPSARWTLGVITMNHLVCGAESSVNGFTMTLLGQSREPLRRHMATWTRHNPIQVVGGLNDHPLSVSELVSAPISACLCVIRFCGVPSYACSAETLKCTTVAVHALKRDVRLQRLETGCDGCSAWSLSGG